MEMLMASTTLLEVEVAATSTSTTATAATKEWGEDVIKVHVLEVLVVTSSTTLSLFMLTNAFFTLLVIDTALIFIT